MATTTLTLYKGTKLDDLKNFAIDDIETYLSSKSPLTIPKFQYQKFLLNMSIKIDKDQSYLLKGATLNRFDYCKISIVNNDTTINYYYFILKASWKAESTIQLDLKMDTLNTYKFADTEADDSYVLSAKTLVNREHKDRLDNEIVYIDENIPFDVNGNFLVRQEMIYVFNMSILYDISVSASANVGTGNSIDRTEFKIKVVNRQNEIVELEETGFNYMSFAMSGEDIVFTYWTTYNGNSSNFVISKDDLLILTFVNITADNGYYQNLQRFFQDSCARQNPLFLIKRIVDEYQEGLGTILFKKNEETLFDADGNNQWYVMFASDNAIDPAVSVSDVEYVNPVQVRFYSDKGYSLNTSSSHEVILYPYSPLIPKWNNQSEFIIHREVNATPLGQKYVKINGVTYDFHDYSDIIAIRKNNNDVLFSEVRILQRGIDGYQYLYKVPSIIYYGINTLQVSGGWYGYAEINIASGSGSYSGSAKSWKEIDLTDPRLIKCIAFPYAPCDFLVGGEYFSRIPEGVVFNTDNVLELNIQQTNLFNYTKVFEGKSPQQELILKINDLSIGTQVARNIKYESKLLHSDYYQPKLVYDSFSFSFNLENVDIRKYFTNSTYYQNLEMNYVCSRNVQSKFMFSFPQYSLKKSIQDYDNVLTIERNNEKALFNNAYINYIRSGGYSYDQKKASSQNAVNGVTSALSIVGATASTIGGVVSGNGILAVAGIGLAVSSAAQIVRSVHTAQEQDRAISQKLLQSYMQGSSVQGSEDIDILTAFSGNKAKLCYYELSDRMKQAMWDLFHYCGYATHEQKVPNVKTRLYFNFVQADIVFDEFSFDEDIADDIKNKWKQGVTFFHKVSGSYDIDQEYENFEVSLIS